MLKVDTIDNVNMLTLDRPESRNALNLGLVRQLSSSLDEADRDRSVRAVVLCGAPPGFCAGSDLKALDSMNVREMREQEAATAALARRIGLSSLPLVGAIEGFALGGGMCLAAACDIVISARDARWQLPEASLGWLPPWGLQTIAARVGPVTARHLAWGWQVVDGTQAYHYRLADCVVEPGSAEDFAHQVARTLAAMPATSVASVKRFFAPMVLGGSEALDMQAIYTFGEQRREFEESPHLGPGPAGLGTS